MSKSNRFTRGDLIDALYQEVPRRAEVLEMLSRPAKNRNTGDLLRLAKEVVSETEVRVLHVHMAALMALVPAQAMATAEARERRENRKTLRNYKAQEGHFVSLFAEVFGGSAQKKDSK